MMWRNVALMSMQRHGVAPILTRSRVNVKSPLWVRELYNSKALRRKPLSYTFICNKVCKICSHNFCAPYSTFLSYKGMDTEVGLEVQVCVLEVGGGGEGGGKGLLPSIRNESNLLLYLKLFSKRIFSFLLLQYFFIICQIYVKNLKKKQTKKKT